MNRIQIRHLILASLEKLDYDLYETFVDISKENPCYDEDAQATLNDAVTVVEDLLSMYKITGRIPVVNNKNKKKRPKNK